MAQGNVLARTWNRRVHGWHQHVNSSEGFQRVLAEVLVAASPAAGEDCVDLGAGTGFLTLALAPQVGTVLAVDISPGMVEALVREAERAGLDGVTGRVADLAALDLPPGSVDLVVSSYALHHLLDPDKRAVVARAFRWLRPGGRLVIADMMFGRGATARDRRILVDKVRVLAAKGVGGWWRIAKNLVRYGLRVGQEHPASPDTWQRALSDAGFVDVAFRPVVAEAGLVTGRRPDGTA